MKDLLLAGGGGHCRAVIEVIERTGRWRIAGIVDPGFGTLAEVSGYPVLGRDEDLPALRRDIGFALVTIGQIRTSAVRRRLSALLVQAGFGLATIVSPRAEVSVRASLCEGVTVMHFAAIGPCAQIGANTIINSRALVEHDCRIGAYCHISTAVTLNGGVVVGDDSFVGSGSVLRENVVIGQGRVIGMGSQIRASDVPGKEKPRG